MRMSSQIEKIEKVAKRQKPYWPFFDPVVFFLIKSVKCEALKCEKIKGRFSKPLGRL